MELAELKELWQRCDTKLDRALSVNLELLQERKLSKAKSALHRFAFFPTLDVIFAAAALLFAGSFLADHWQVVESLIPGAIVFAASLALLIASVHDLYLVTQIDFGKTVTANQQSLELLKLSRIRTFKWAILLGPLVGFAAMIVLLKTLTGVDIIQQFDRAWVIANYIFGMAFIPLGYLFAGWLSKRLEETTFLSRACDDICGRNLAAATRRLEELRELELAASD